MFPLFPNVSLVSGNQQEHVSSALLIALYTMFPRFPTYKGKQEKGNKLSVGSAGSKSRRLEVETDMVLVCTKTSGNELKVKG